MICDICAIVIIAVTKINEKDFYEALRNTQYHESVNLLVIMQAYQLERSQLAKFRGGAPLTLIHNLQLKETPFVCACALAISSVM